MYQYVLQTNSEANNLYPCCRLHLFIYQLCPDSNSLFLLKNDVKADQSRWKYWFWDEPVCTENHSLCYYFQSPFILILMRFSCKLYNMYSSQYNHKENYNCDVANTRPDLLKLLTPHLCYHLLLLLHHIYVTTTSTSTPTSSTSSTSSTTYSYYSSSFLFLLLFLRLLFLVTACNFYPLKIQLKANTWKQMLTKIRCLYSSPKFAALTNFNKDKQNKHNAFLQ